MWNDFYWLHDLTDRNVTKMLKNDANVTSEVLTQLLFYVILYNMYEIALENFHTMLYDI